MEYEKAFKVIFWVLSGVMFAVALGVLMFLQSIYHTVYAKINGKTITELEEKAIEEQPESAEQSFNPFSEREMEVIFYTIKGYGAVEVADKLKISKRTVERHKENMKDKTDSKNFTGVIYYALTNRLFTDKDLKKLQNH
ncbi:MAG: helix-turn-helix transcriptional regulator [Flavobacteriaceae bacterium]|jgi:DNA-binding NarL/FixJ family response regulator